MPNIAVGRFDTAAKYMGVDRKKYEIWSIDYEGLAMRCEGFDSRYGDFGTTYKEHMICT